MSYIEFKPGEKFAGNNAEVSDDLNAFPDAGYLIGKDEIIVDIDNQPRELCEAIHNEFCRATQMVITDRGVHLYFRKPVWFSKRHDGVCALGIPIEQHTSTSRPNGITIKRNGKAREIINEGMRMAMPKCFEIGTKKHPYEDLTGLGEGEGRNKALYRHRCHIDKNPDKDKILRFINENVFSEPLSDSEFETVSRDMEVSDKPEDDRYWLAGDLIEEFHITMYSGVLWWYSDGQYSYEESNDRLIRTVYDRCEGKDSKYVNEILNQIKMRAPIVRADAVFPIRFRNGILTDGEFIEYKDYKQFTPYFIDVDYDPNAAAQEVVDEYLFNLTDGEDDYRDLLCEVLGYALVTDPEKIRSLGKFFMFRGDGANGKGTLLHIMNKILGDRNCTAMSIKQLVDKSYNVTMIGKLANLGDDIEPETIDNDQMKMLKNISTADKVSTRRLYKQSEEATFTAKLYFTTNSDIKSFEKGYAYRRRVLWLPMFNKVPKPDPHFITKITTEDALKYWIRLIVDGYFRLYENGTWTESEKVNVYNDAYHKSNDMTGEFIRDLGEKAFLGKTMTDVKNMFTEWAADETIKMSGRSFKETIMSLWRMEVVPCKIDGKMMRAIRYLKTQKPDTEEQ